MARFSVTEAATSGFGLIGREPLAVLVWGLVVLAVLVLPCFGLVWAVFPDFVSFAKLTEAQGADPSGQAAISQMMQLQSKMMLFNLIYLVGGTGVKAVLAAAVFRAVLEPGQKGFAYLKLGAQELWLALVSLVMGILAYMACMAAAIVVAICAAIAYFAGAQSGQAAGVGACILVAVVLGLAAAGALIWAMLRLSMAGPMSFSERKFLLFESWTFTRGQAWPLLGMTLLLGLIIVALELVLYAVFGVGVFAFGLKLLPRMQTMTGQPPEAWLRLLWPYIAGFAVVGSLLSGPAMALVFAPWATAYRDLKVSA
jgi:hypothetical protein